MNNNETNNQNSGEYIRLADAARFVPYNKDYIALLARQGKIDAKKIGRDWHTTQLAVQEYYRNQETRRSLLSTGRPTLATFSEEGSDVDGSSDERPVFQPRWENLRQETPETQAPHEPSVSREVPPVSFRPARSIVSPLAPPTPKGTSSFSLIARFVIPVVALLVIFGGVRITPADKMVYGVKDFVVLASEMRKEFVRVVEGGLVAVDEGGNMEVLGNVQAGGQLISTIMDGIAPLVVRSTTTVSNLSAQYLDGVTKEEIDFAFVTRNGAVTASRVVLRGGADIASLVVDGTASIATLATQSFSAEKATIDDARIERVDIGQASIAGLSVSGGSILSDTQIDGTLDVSGTATLRRANVRGRLSVDGTLSVTDVVSAPSFSGGSGSFGNVDIENKLSFADSTVVNLYKKLDVSENVLVTDASFQVGGTLSIAGAFTPATDNTQSIGSTTLRWKDAFVGPEGIKIYNTTGDDAEYATLGYATNVITLRSTADGAGTARNFNITGGNVGIGTAVADNALTIDDGSLSFSTGEGASDVVVFRGAANRLDVADGDSVRIVGGTLQLDLDDTGATQGVVFGSTSDVNLYRSAANTLRTDDSLVINAQLQLPTSGSSAAGILLGGDVNIYRTASNRLNLGDDDILTFPSRSATSDVFLESAVAGDAFYRFQITANGTLQWGDGTATRDTNLYRSAANTLRTDDSLYIGGSLTVDGLTTSNGSVDLGDTAADTITFIGVVDSNIVPDADVTRNLGSLSRQWDTIYADTVTASNLAGTVVTGDTSSASWLINSDNATANAEISTLAFNTGTNPFNATLQWNASGDAGRISGFDDTFLTNYPIAIFSEVSGPNQTFTSGTLFSYSQSATHAITQSGTFTGINVDFSSNITNATGNQTGIALTLKDGSVSGTSTGLSLSGTADYGINLSGATIGTAAIVLPTGTAAAQGIDFGGDTNLYRSAANTLRTDDSLIVGTDLTVLGTFDGSAAAGSFDSLTVGGGYGSTGVTISSAGVVQADGGITSGVDDATRGEITLYGQGAGQVQGGRVNFWFSADHDTTLQYLALYANQDDLRVTGSDSRILLDLASEGQLKLPYGASTGGLLIGGDTQLYRGAADRLDLASGDSLNIVSGRFTVAAGTNPKAIIGGTSTFNGNNDVEIQGNGRLALIRSSYGGTLEGVYNKGSAAVDGNVLLDILGGGHNGTTAVEKWGSRITLQAAGTWSGTSQPGKIVFQTVPSGSTTLTTVATLDSAGQLQLPTTGSSAGLLIGGDVQLYRDAANSLTVPDTVKLTGDNVLIGTSSVRGGLANDAPKFQIEGTNSTSSTLSIINNIDNTGGAVLILGKSRGASVGSSTIVQTGDTLGSIYFAGADGTDMNNLGARITAFVDGGTPGSDDLPTSLGFYTTADGAGGFSTRRMTLTSTGQVQLLDTGSSAGLLIGGDFHIYRLGADFGYTPDTFQVGGAFQADTTAYFPGGIAPGGGIIIGGDVNLYRGAANRLDLASGDSLNVVSGAVGIGATNTNTNTFYLAGASSPGGTGSVFDLNPTMSGNLNLFNFVSRVRGSFSTSTSILGTGNGGFHMLGIDTEALNSSAGALTIAQASGLFIEGAPTAGTNMTITNAYALFVDAGLTRLDGGVEIGSLSTANTTALCWDNSGNSLIYDCNGSATDLAELYGTTDASIEAADIVVSAGEAETILDEHEGEPTSRAFIEKATTPYESGIIGVISTNPNQVYGEDGVFSDSDNPRPVSLAGRVPVKVTTQNGPIKTGDAITSSDIPGVGMRATEAGRIIGIALGNYQNENQTEIGTVIVFVNTSWWSPSSSGLAAVEEASQEGGVAGSSQTTIITSIQGLIVTTVSATREFVFDGAVTARGVFASLFNISTERLGSFATSFISSLVNSGNDLIADSSKLKQEASADGTGPVQITTYSLQTSRQEIMISGTGMMRKCSSYSAEGVSGCNAIAGMLGFSTNFASDDVAGVIAFAPEFSALLDADETVQVLVTPTDQVFGTLYVANKSVRGFVVGESIVADAGATFDWIIIARIGDGTGSAQVEEILAQSQVIDPLSNAGVDENGIPGEFYEQYPDGYVAPAPSAGSDEAPEGEEPAPVGESGAPLEESPPPVVEEPEPVEEPIEESPTVPAESSAPDESNGGSEPGNTTTP